MGWQDDDMDRYSPSVRRRQLGRRARQERERAGLTSDQAAPLLGIKPSTLTKMETADRRLTKPVLMLMQKAYGLSDKVSGELQELHDQASARGWFQEYRVAAGSYVDFEAEATQIQSADTLLVPGLLQTEAYARAILAETTVDVPQAQRDAWMRARLARAEILTDDDAPHVWCVVSEAALLTVVGSREIMAAQIRHIAEMSRTVPRLEVQILPFYSGQHAAMEGGFSILTFDELPTLGYIENEVSAVWLERQSQINQLTRAFGRLMGQALPSRRTVARLSKLADWMEDDEFPLLAEE